MKLSLGSDHAGFKLRTELVELLKAAGHEVTDHGTFTPESVDYPDFAQKACADVVEKRSDFGVLVCGTGVGVSIAANKIHGIRAFLAINEDASKMTRHHNNSNVICFGQKYHTAQMAMIMIENFINTPYDGGRHNKRLDKLAKMEEAY